MPACWVWVTGWESADVANGLDFGGLIFFCFAFGFTLVILERIEILVLCLDPRPLPPLVIGLEEGQRRIERRHGRRGACDACWYEEREWQDRRGPGLHANDLDNRPLIEH